MKFWFKNICFSIVFIESIQEDQELYLKVSLVQLVFMLYLYVVIALIAWTDFRFCYT